VQFNTVAAGAHVIFSFFDISMNVCNMVGTPGSGFGQSGEGYFRLSAFGGEDKEEFEVSLIEEGR